MRIFIFLCLFILTAPVAQAQESSDDLSDSDTPRQKIVEEVIESPEPELVLKLRGVSESEPEEELTLESEIIEEPTPEQSEPEEEAEPANKVPVVLAPFYLSAIEYITQRGDTQQDQLILDYEVSTGALDEGAEPRTEDVRLILGSDFASIQRPNSQKIYDFKMNRYLEIKSVKTLDNDTDTTLLFDNTSLYAKAYRGIATARQATQNGQKRRIQIAEDQEIDSFWLESSMSWAAADLEQPLKIKSTKTNLLAIWDGTSVVSSNFEGDPFEDESFKNTLLAFAHHAWPIHPKILIDFYKQDAPPQNLEMVSFGPAMPKGQKQKWVLKNRDFTSAGFPLPTEALSVIERRPASPLVFVLAEAVSNRAMGGIAAPEQIEADFEAAIKADNKLAQWVAGQRYVAYTGKCLSKDESWLCAALNDLSETNKFASISELDPKNKTLSDFINAVEMAKFKKNRATALFTLQPYLDDAETPAFVLRIAAMARASMKKAEAEKSGFGSIQPEALLKRAMAKDPYDPHTYLGLAQVYAAKGAYEQSWDIYDVLRAGIPTVEALSLKIDEAETKLRSTGPGYFLQN